MADGLANEGATLGFCVTPQTGPLTPTAFAALTYADVCCLVTVPDLEQAANIVSGFCISGVEKVAVVKSAGAEITVQFYYEPTCIGQSTIRDIKEDGDKRTYAIRLQRADGDADQTPTTFYALVMVAGWTDGGGDREALVTDTAVLRLIQDAIRVLPTPIP